MPQQYDALILQLAAYAIEPLTPSKEALATARLCLADALGCAIAALQFPACTKLLGPVVPGTIVPFGCRVPGIGHVLDPVCGAFNLGSMIRWLDYNDTWLAVEWAHPSDNIGGLLMLADHLQQCKIGLCSPDASQDSKQLTTVHDLLIAIIKAYEIQGILCLSNSFNSIGLDHIMFVKVATAAVAISLLDGTTNDACAAISNAWVDICPLRTYRHAPNVGSRKSWAAGDATSRGIQFALMAMKGEMGYPKALSAARWGLCDALFEGKPLTIDQDLGCYVMENILFKVDFPAEFHAQTAVEEAIAIHKYLEKQSLSIEDIASIHIETHAAAIRIIDKKGPLRNPADRDHCLQYMIAIGLIYGELTANHYEDAIASDPKIDALRNIMTVTENKQYSANYLDPSKRSISNRIQVKLIDGTTIDFGGTEYPIGHRKRRTEAIPRIWNKLQSSLETHYSKEQSNIILCAVQRDDIDQMPISKFVDLFIN